MPKSLGTAKRSTNVKPIAAGTSRAVTVTLRIAKRARYGTHRVKISVGLGGSRVTRTVDIQVKR
jgi:uncharacterized membrane protein